MGFAALQVERDGDTIRITMNRPERRNALSADHLVELREAFTQAARSDATGIVLGAQGTVFSAESAGFALPGGRGGWFCHTPAVPVARSIGRKRLMEMALTGDVVGARTASQLAGAKEGMAAFLEKRRPAWPD